METVPTDLQRMGDFSQTVQSTGGGLEPVQIFNRATNLPYPNNIIPASQISPIALGLLSYIPMPNQAGLVNNYQYLTSVPQDTDNLELSRHAEYYQARSPRPLASAISGAMQTMRSPSSFSIPSAATV